MKKTTLYYSTVTFVAPVIGACIALFSDMSDKFSKHVCTRYCHGNGGCKHEPMLPDSIASDDGLYGDVIRGLFDFGDVISSLTGVTYAEGYGLANLLIFCLAVPIAHFSLLLLTLAISRSK